MGMHHQPVSWTSAVTPQPAPALALPLLPKAVQNAVAMRDAVAAMLAGDAARRTEVAARAEKIAASRISAAHLMMPLLSALGAVDAAFRVADALYRGRGPLALPVTSPNGGAAPNYQQLRRAVPLFVPTAGAMRADPRFRRLAREIGLVAAWRAMGGRRTFLRSAHRGPEPAVRKPGRT